MKRRELFGFLPLPFFLSGKTERMKKLVPPILVRQYSKPQGPTMDQLVHLQRGGDENARYYAGLMARALAITGSLCVNGDSCSVLYTHGIALSAHDDASYVIASVRTAQSVFVPESLLKYFRPEDRGEDFPAGIPFEPLT